MGKLNQISHPLHPNHPLVLHDNEYSYRCDGCNLPGHGTRYRCNVCDFDLHPDCLANQVGQPQAQAQAQVRNVQAAQNAPNRGGIGGIGRILGTMALSVGVQALVSAVGIDIDVADLIGEDPAEA